MITWGVETYQSEAELLEAIKNYVVDHLNEFGLDYVVLPDGSHSNLSINVKFVEPKKRSNSGA